MTDLKPCAACHSEARLEFNAGVVGKATRARYWRGWVECKKCKLRTREYKSPDKAIAAWNTRAFKVPEAVREMYRGFRKTSRRATTRDQIVASAIMGAKADSIRETIRLMALDAGADPDEAIRQLEGE